MPTQDIRIRNLDGKNIGFTAEHVGDSYVDVPAQRQGEQDRPAGTPSSRAVFVVHGRDQLLKDAMFDFLRALDLTPLEWTALVRPTGQGAPFVGTVVEQAVTQAQAAVVLLSPDDIVRLHPDLVQDDDPYHERVPGGQARPNVLVELGMVLATYPERTIIVQAGELRPVGDLAGRHVIRINGGVEPLNRIKERLATAGCAVRTDGEAWLNAARFANLPAYRRSPY